MICETSICLSKYGPVDLLTITEMPQNIQEKYGIILDKYYLCQYGTQEISNIFEKLYVLGTMRFDVFGIFSFFCNC